MLRSNQRLLIYAALAVLFAALFTARMDYVRREQAKPFGRYSAQQILAHSEPLCRALAPQAASLKLSALRTPEGVDPPQWLVSCTDETGREIATLDWNAETGDLVRVGHAVRRTTRGNEIAVKANEAVHAAWQWLCTLGMAGQSSRWHLLSRPCRGNGKWMLRWQADDRRATIFLDDQTGEPVLALVAPNNDFVRATAMSR